MSAPSPSLIKPSPCGIPTSTDFLAPHDACLDLLVGKLTSALDMYADSPKTLAKHALASIPATAQRPTVLLMLAFRKTLVNTLKVGHEQNERRPAMLDAALALTDAAIVLARDRHVETTLSPVLLEYVFTFHTLAELEARIGMIRKRFVAFRDSQPDSVASLYMIKAVMSCINRDQPGSNPVLSGHLRLMLAASLPVWHPSGLNRRAQFNTSNVLDYDAVLKREHTHGVDVALYRAFWCAQAVMVNPTQAETPGRWREAHDAIDRVLTAFETLKPVADAVTAVSSHSEKDKAVMGHTGIPKYLTAPSVLRQQLEDMRLRRHVLMQYAILLHHLLVVSRYVATPKDSPTARAGIEFCKKLFQENGEGEVLRKRVHAALDTDGTGKYRKFVTTLLQRERRWIAWKKVSGYGHLSARQKLGPGVFKRRKCGSKVNEPATSAVRGFVQSWTERQETWEVPVPSKRKAPLVDRGGTKLWSAEHLKEELKEDMDDEDVTEDMKRKNCRKYIWRTLRMLCEEVVSSVVKLADGKNGALDLEELIVEKNIVDSGKLGGAGNGAELEVSELSNAVKKE